MFSPEERDQLSADDLRLLKLYEARRYAHLLSEVGELAKQGPPGPAAFGLAALTHLALQQVGDALRAADIALGGAPGWAWLHHVRAASASGAGKVVSALVSQREAVRLAPGVALYHAALAGYLRAAGDLAAAQESAEAAVALAPDGAAGLNELGLVHFTRGDADRALTLFRRGQALAPADALAYYHEGLLHLERGDRSSARRSFRAALRRDPDFEAAEDRLAESLIAGTPGLGLRCLIFWGRFTLVGWALVAFLYYVAFRLLQMLWRVFPSAYPAARWLLLATLACLLLGLAGGRLARFVLRRVG